MLVFAVEDAGKIWQLTDAQIAAWVAQFVGLDVAAECGKALAWTDANPTKRKTARGMKRFLVNWLLRASSRPKLVSSKQAPGPPTSTHPPYFESCKMNGHSPPCADYDTHLRKFGMRIAVDNTSALRVE